MKKKPDHPNVPVYRVRSAPDYVDARAFGRTLASRIGKPEDQTWELILTDDRYLAWTDLDEHTPTVTVACHMLGYGPEISGLLGEGLHIWMQFRATPGQDHGLELPAPFYVLTEDYEKLEPTNGFVHPSRPQFGL